MGNYFYRGDGAQRIKVLLEALAVYWVVFKRDTPAPPWLFKGLNDALESSSLKPWHVVVLSLFTARMASQLPLLLDMHAPHRALTASTQLKYSPGFTRVQRILTSLDAGMLTTSRIRFTPLRNTMAMIMSAYYVLNGRAAENIVQRYQTMVSVDMVRIMWQKGTHPLFRMITYLTSPSLPIPGQNIHITRPDGSIATCQLYSPVDAATFQSLDIKKLIIVVGGGGFIAMKPENHREWVTKLVHETRLPAILIPYRKAPEHPYPTPFEDVFNIIYKIVSSEGREIGMSGRWNSVLERNKSVENLYKEHVANSKVFGEKRGLEKERLKKLIKSREKNLNVIETEKQVFPEIGSVPVTGFQSYSPLCFREIDEEYKISKTLISTLSSIDNFSTSPLTTTTSSTSTSTSTSTSVSASTSNLSSFHYLMLGDSAGGCLVMAVINRMIVLKLRHQPHLQKYLSPKSLSLTNTNTNTNTNSNTNTIVSLPPPSYTERLYLEAHPDVPLPHSVNLIYPVLDLGTSFYTNRHLHLQHQQRSFAAASARHTHGGVSQVEKDIGLGVESGSLSDLQEILRNPVYNGYNSNISHPHSLSVDEVLAVSNPETSVPNNISEYPSTSLNPFSLLPLPSPHIPLHSRIQRANDAVLPINFQLLIADEIAAGGGDAMNDMYISPLRAPDDIIQFYPNIVIHVGEMDPLRQDSEDLINRLTKVRCWSDIGDSHKYIAGNGHPVYINGETNMSTPYLPRLPNKLIKYKSQYTLTPTVTPTRTDMLLIFKGCSHAYMNVYSLLPEGHAAMNISKRVCVEGLSDSTCGILPKQPFPVSQKPISSNTHSKTNTLSIEKIPEIYDANTVNGYIAAKL